MVAATLMSMRSKYGHTDTLVRDRETERERVGCITFSASTGTIWPLLLPPG